LGPPPNNSTLQSRGRHGWLMFLPTSWSREVGIEARALLEVGAPGAATTSCEVEVEDSLEASSTDRATVASS
jgi:hypothetical protein